MKGRLPSSYCWDCSQHASCGKVSIPLPHRMLSSKAIIFFRDRKCSNHKYFRGTLDVPVKVVFCFFWGGGILDCSSVFVFWAFFPDHVGVLL